MRNDYDGLYFALQKAVGVILILAALLIGVLCDDFTGPAFVIFIGIALIVVREKVLFVGEG